MLSLNRRGLFASASAAILTGCAASPTGKPQVSLASAVAFAQGAEGMLLGQSGAPGLLQVLAPLAPGVLTPTTLALVKTDLGIGQTILAGITPATPPGTAATGLQAVEGYVNAAMALVAQIAPATPGLVQYTPAIDAVTVAVELVEVFVNAQLAAQGAPVPAAPPVAVPPQTSGETPAMAARGPVAAAHQRRILAMRAGAAERHMTTAQAANILGVKE